MFVGLMLVFLMGAVTVYQGTFTTSGIITMIIAGLLAVEHSLNGSTDPTPTPAV